MTCFALLGILGPVLHISAHTKQIAGFDVHDTCCAPESTRQNLVPLSSTRRALCSLVWITNIVHPGVCDVHCTAFLAGGKGFHELHGSGHDSGSVGGP